MGTLSTALRIARGGTAFAPPAAQQQRGTTYLGGLTLTDQGLQLDDRERGFEHVAVAYRCVSMIASNLASVPLVVMRDDEAHDDHEVARLWNVGVDGAQYSARTIREVAFARAELAGESFTYIDRGDTGTGPARGLHPIFDRVEVVTKRDNDRTNGIVAGYIVKARGGDVPLLPSEVLWLRYPHPFKRWGSLAPWRAALYAVESDAYARAWQRGEFKNGARPSSLINLGEVESDVYERAIAMIRTRVEGPSNAGKSMIVRQSSGSTAKPTVQHLSLSPAEMSYLESRVANSDEVMLAFGINPDLMRAGSTYENRAAAKTAMWSDTLLPKLDTAGSELDRQLLPLLGDTAAFDLSQIDALRDSQDAVITRASNATYPDIAMIDEARAMIGLEPLPFGLGQFTLTPYRERARATAQIELLNATAERSTVQPLRHLRVNGATRTHRNRAVRSRDTETLHAYERHERIGVRLVQQLAERQLKAVMRELKAQGRRAPEQQTVRQLFELAAAGQVLVHDDDALHYADEQQRVDMGSLFDLTFWTGETRRALEPFMLGVWTEGGQRTSQQLGASWDHLDPLVIAKMDQRLDVLSSLVTSTTRAALEAQIVQAGVEDGDDIDAIAERLRGVFDNLSGHRARTIARTETVGGFNAAAHEVAAQSGLLVTRQWLATGDDRTRPSHARQNGHTLRGAGGAYPNGCAYPGDPNAPASETVNCRCVELFDTEQ